MAARAGRGSPQQANPEGVGYAESYANQGYSHIGAGATLGEITNYVRQ